jgi:hypothetical protein
LGQFDPFNFLEGKAVSTIKKYREAEVTHGRVAMLASIGFIAGEQVAGTSFLFNSEITGPAINHLAQVPQPFWSILVLGIGVAEVYRAQVGWVSPVELQGQEQFQLREDYYPGDLGFDPLGLRPQEEEDFDQMASRELVHGRLAMLAIVGMVSQELVNGQGILEHLQVQFPGLPFIN